MSKSEIESKEGNGKEIRFPLGYKRRSKEDLFKFFIIENRKSLRGFKRFLPVAILSILIWLITKNTITLIIMLPCAVFLIIAIIGYYDIWRVRKNWEKKQILRRIIVKERILKYGNFGIVFTEESKNGLSEEKYAWSRYGNIIEWEKWMFLIPAKKKAYTFEINRDEIGKENFSEFRDFAKLKLDYRLVTDYKEII